MIFLRERLLVIAFWLITNCVAAQSINAKALRIGEKLPDISFTAFVEDKGYLMKTSDFKGKLILFDFWGTGCSSCIEGMPKLLKLQQIYGDKIKIILVTTDQRQDIQKYLKDLTDKKIAVQAIQAGKKLTYIYGDTIFSKLFPYQGVPVHAWIDREQKHLSMAYASSATEENIQSLLASKTIEFDKYVKPQFSGFNFSYKSWVSRRFGVVENVDSFSAFFRFDSLSKNNLIDCLKDSVSRKPIGVAAINSNLFDLYRFAYYGPNGVNNHNILSVEVNDKKQFDEPAFGSFNWGTKNRYSYISRVCVKDTAKLFSKMITDLNNYFSFSSGLEKRMIKCFVLKRSHSNDLLQPKNSKSTSAQFISKKEFVLQNMSFDALTSRLWSLLIGGKDNIPVFFLDETNYKGQIDITIPEFEDVIYNNKANLSILREKLNKYGLILDEEERLLNVLVIQDAKKDL